jgi:hypothetical protein
MQRKTRRIIVAVALIALLAAGGAAFTDGLGGVLDGQNANIGYGSETITGAPATAVNYTLDANGQYIEDVDVTLTGDFTTAGYHFVGSLTGTGAYNGDSSDTNTYNGTGLNAGDNPTNITQFPGVCTPNGAYDQTNNDTDIQCVFTGVNSGAGVYVDTATGFQLSVTGKNDSGTTETFHGNATPVQ